MPVCIDTSCPRSRSCQRHRNDSSCGTDYSHGAWFRPDDCFWFKPIETTPPKRERAGVYGGKTLP